MTTKQQYKRSKVSILHLFVSFYGISMATPVTRRVITVTTGWSHWIYKLLTREETFVAISFLIFALHIILFKPIPRHIIVCLYLLTADAMFRRGTIVPRKVRSTITSMSHVTKVFDFSLYLRRFPYKNLWKTAKD